MPYPRHLINEGETVALDLHPHWWYFSKHILTGIPLFLALIGVFTLSGSVQAVAGWAWAIFAVIWAGWLAIKYVQWQYTHFVVTDDRVIFRTGMLSKHGVEIPLERINNINFDQRIFERLIGAGDLDIESAGREGQSHFEDVRHPDGVQQEIYRQMEVNAKETASWSAPLAPAGGGANVPDQIEQLAALRDKGHITVEEFEIKKAALLDRM
ncbi:MAG TPA: PH domain-containing protein [Acidimicrobiia bacterium]|nr:PH domain-containing protein [Acidimicrobiia bacterium]